MSGGREEREREREGEGEEGREREREGEGEEGRGYNVILCLVKSGDQILYSGYFSGGKIFVEFVVERRTTKFLKQYCIVWHLLTYCDHEHFSMKWPKIHCS